MNTHNNLPPGTLLKDLDLDHSDFAERLDRLMDLHDWKADVERDDSVVERNETNEKTKDELP